MAYADYEYYTAAYLGTANWPRFDPGSRYAGDRHCLASCWNWVVYCWYGISVNYWGEIEVSFVPIDAQVKP